VLAEDLSGSLAPAPVTLWVESQRPYQYAADGFAADAPRLGNGHAGLSVKTIEHLFGDVGGAPLWARLDGETPLTAAPPSPPPRLASPGSRPGRVAAKIYRLPDAAAFRHVLRRTVTWRVGLLFPLALLVIAGVVVGTNLTHWPETQFDEGTYTGYAWAVQHGRLANYTYSYGHPPLAWLLIFFWIEATRAAGCGGFSVDHGREFMLVLCLTSCALLYVLARRLGFSRVTAGAALALFALCPLGIFYHRALLLDNPSMAFAIAAFLLAWTPRRSLWAFAGSGACFALSVLCKETTLALLPAVVVAVIQNADRRTKYYCVMLFLVFFLLTGGIYPLYATLKGELLPGHGHVSLMGYMIVQLFTRKGSGSIFDPYSQVHAIVKFWLQVDPWLLFAALAVSPIALARRSTRAVTLAFLIQIATLFRPGYLPNMYVIGMLPFAALMVPGSIEALWRWARLLKIPVIMWSARVVVAAIACTAALFFASRWATGDRIAMTISLDSPERAAEQWLVDHVGRDKRLIVTDQYWIYLIDHGYNDQPMPGGFFSKTVVSYWPLDYDPAVKKAFPLGWREFNYIVVNQDMFGTLAQTPSSAAAIDHSHVVASFGRGVSKVQIRQITPISR
jgi:Dolichyl-phosphate-mannose-protein mannosyltransferase